MRVALIALAAALLAFGVRRVHTLGRPLEEAGAKIVHIESFDPDSQYHARRVARAVADGGAVAGRDPLLAWPVHVARGGAPIPWPPYYDAVLAAVARLRLGPGPGPSQRVGEGASIARWSADDERVRRVAADTVARAPAWLAALTAAFASLAAAALVRAASRASAATRSLKDQAARPVSSAVAAAVAGGLGVALSFAHLRYSYVGMGDHHTAVSALYVLLLALVSWGVGPEAVRGPRMSAFRGALAGLVGGALLGTWVASFALLVPVQLVLAWLLLRPGRPAPVGLALFAASFHKALVLALLPAAFTSPWSEDAPFDVVNLSWFHVAWFAIAWLAFAPVVFLPRSTARRAPAVLATLLLVVLALRARTGTRDALEWVTASNVFMASITESQPFESLTAALKWLGHGAWLVLPTLAVGTVRVLTRRDDRLAPWLAAVVTLAVAAALQRRFAEALAAPLAVLCAWFIGHVWQARGARAGAVLLVLSALHLGTLRATLARLAGPRFVTNESALQHGAVAAVLAPLRDLPPEARRGVLAEWDHGHALEWWGAAPTLATNFGLYLGVHDFLDPWRFLLAVDDGEAEALLERRDVGFVFVTRDAQRNLGAALAALDRPPLDDAGWRRTQVARLVASDRSDAEAHAPFLRLVAARGFEGTPGTYARLFERVPGARVVVSGEPGARVSLRMRIEAEDGGLLWSLEDTVGADGVCALRVPYPTERDTEMSPFGAAGVARTVELTVGGRARALIVRTRDVLDGARVEAGQ
jgi:hypothetical protein